MDNQHKNLILIGLMGAGKTTIGRRLAEHWQRPFYDSDHVVCERTGVAIPTIFELEGEEGFRNRESAVIGELCALKGIVLATGGGAVLREANRACLRRDAVVVYLHVAPEILYERTRCDRNRPLLQVDNPLQKIRDLYAQRDPIYRQTAHIVLDVAQSSCPNTFKQLLHALEHNL